MKTTIRAFVIALTLTGAVASARTPTTIQTSTRLAHPTPESSRMPVPMCPPNDPNACGIVR